MRRRTAPAAFRVAATLALLAAVAGPAAAHGGEDPAATVGREMVVLRLYGEHDDTYGENGRALCAGAAVARDDNGNGVYDREPHPDDPGTPQDESHDADTQRGDATLCQPLPV